MSKEARLTKYKTVLTEDGRARIKKCETYICSGERLHMNGLDKVVSFARDYLKLDKETDEYAYMICLDTKLQAIAVFEISHGTVNTTVCNPRDVFQKALLANAVDIILIHNHPSGLSTPSLADKDLTERIAEAGAIIGIRLLDHVIIGKYTYSSFLDMGMITKGMEVGVVC